MAVDKETVAKIAKLARIRIDESQQTSLAGELSQILTWVEQLSELDTSGIEPMTSVVEMESPMREDVVADGGYPEKIVANAPEATQDYFVVPKVVE